MPTHISVIICTHNPRMDYLARTLESLRGQTLRYDKWELLLIDNCSDTSLRTRVDVSWHVDARIVEESRLGLTPARLRGIADAKGDILVFVDDDNILDPEYLEHTANVAAAWPILGAWGAANICPEFEAPPPEWSKPYLKLMAIRSTDRDRWSNCGAEASVPLGAGLCVRRTVAESYAEMLGKSALRTALDRRGSDLSGGGDTDLALTSSDLGQGTGVFTSLRLTHLIPPKRLTADYVLRLTEGLAYSGVIFRFLRDTGYRRPSWKRRLLEYVRAWMSLSFQRRVRFAAIRGQAKAWKTLRELSRSVNPGEGLPGACRVPSELANAASEN